MVAVIERRGAQSGDRLNIFIGGYAGDHQTQALPSLWSPRREPIENLEAFGCTPTPIRPSSLMHSRFTISKSRLLAYRQCPRRLWLEVNRRDLLEVSAAQQSRFDAGHRVGEMARHLADPAGEGILFDAQRDGYDTVLRASRLALAERRPLFEAGFTALGAIVFVDLLLPEEEARQGCTAWRLVEVKSSGSVKPYHWDDLAVQVHVLRSAGVNLSSAAVACVDTGWTYPGGGRYAGLLREEEGLDDARARAGEVQGWIDGGMAVLARDDEPHVSMGDHCRAPFECPFTAHCGRGQPQAVHPVHWLPRRQRTVLKDFLRNSGATDMSEVPDELLNATQRRVKHATLTGQVWFDGEGARRALAPHAGTLRFLDFEAAARPVPVWAGSRPYQQVPFQFSLHTLHEDWRVGHDEFIDLSGNDPTESFARTRLWANDLVGSLPLRSMNSSWSTRPSSCSVCKLNWKGTCW